MKAVGALVAALLVAAGCAPTGQMATADPGVGVSEYDVRALEYPALRDVALPEVQRVELPNGLVVFLTEDRALPLVRASARIGAGSLWEPAEQVGLASLTGQVMRAGGAGERSPDDLNAFLEGLGASVEVSVGDDAAFASMSTLAEHVEEVLPAFVDVLTRPNFDPQQVELAKTRAKSQIARRNDNPQSIATRELFKLVYGEDSPYARHTEYATIDAIDREDLIAFHRQYFHPNNTYLAVWGDFDADQMAAQLREAFADWPEAEGFTRPAPPPAEAPLERSIAFIPKDDVTQSTVLIGHAGAIRLDHPDYFPVLLMNEILGGGFSSRLFQTVRSDLGLAYAVFGTYTADYEVPGVFYSGTFTKSESTVEAARAMLRVIEGMKTEAPTADELQRARDAYLNTFVFNFDTKQEVLNRQMTYAYYGYPEDFIQRIKEGVEAVTAEDVQRVAQAYLHPDRARILVLGRAEDFGEPVSALGTVDTLDVTIPLGPPSGGPMGGPALEGDDLLGQTRFEEALEALGGRAAFAAVEAVRYVAESEMQAGGQTVTLQSEALVELPDRVRAVQATPMGQVTVVIDGARGVIRTPGGDQAAPPALITQIRDQLWQDLPYLLARADELRPAMITQPDGTEELLIQAPDGPQLRLTLDPETHRPARLAMTVTTMQGPQDVVVEFHDYREVDGLLLPFRTVQVSNGEPSGSSVYSSIEVNPPIEPGTFDLE